MIWSSIDIGIGQFLVVSVSDVNRAINVKRHIVKSHNMYVNYHIKVFQCLCTLFKDLYIDFYSCINCPKNFEMNSHSLCANEYQFKLTIFFIYLLLTLIMYSNAYYDIYASHSYRLYFKYYLMITEKLEKVLVLAIFCIGQSFCIAIFLVFNNLL